MTKPKRNPPPDQQSKTAGESWIQHVFRAGGYSMAGIVSGWRDEMAIRMESTLAVLMIPAAFFVPVSIEMKALMIMSVLLVLMVELLNSGLEWAVDYISLDHHPYAKKIKDMGSAAVFFSLINAGVVWAFGLYAGYLA